jgi:hypothetical protein
MLNSEGNGRGGWKRTEEEVSSRGRGCDIDIWLISQRYLRHHRKKQSHSQQQ